MNTSMIWMGRAFALTLFSVLCLAPSPGHAQVPQTISYQGSLIDATGTPITASLGITFRLYDSLSPLSGTLLWEEKQSVAVANGSFDVVLGADAGNPLELSLFEIPLYLGIAVGGDPEMVPRRALAAVGYAFRSAVAEALATPAVDTIINAAVPSGAVWLFDLPSCPAGWSELVSARGRALVGLPAGGSAGGTLGTPLGDLENRTHTHDVDPASVASTAAAAHGHSVNPPNTKSESAGQHFHSVDPPETESDLDIHNHRWAYITNEEAWISFTSTGGTQTMIDHGTSGMDLNLASRKYPVSVPDASSSTRTYYTDPDGHTHKTDLLEEDTTTVSAHTHDVDITLFGTGGAVAGTRIPSTSPTAPRPPPVRPT